jgi:glycosyltransferase involved in cell wall biosynthesis
MRFLLISSSYPPWQTSGSIRPAMLAKHLVKHGHECAVLTLGIDCIPTKDDSLLDDVGDIPTHRVFPRVIIPYTLFRENQKPPQFLGKVLRKLSLYFTPDVFYYWSIRAAKSYMKDPILVPEVVFSTALPFSVHYAGHIISRWSKAFWVADFRDLFVDNPVDRPPEKSKKRLLRYQKKILRNVNLVTCINENMIDCLKPLLNNGTRFSALANAFNEETMANDKEYFDRAQNNKYLRFTYTGRLYGNRDLCGFFQVIREIIQDSGKDILPIRLIYAGPDGNLFLGEAAKYNLQDLVEDVGLVSHNAALALQRQSEALLLPLGLVSKNESMIVSGKVFEYLSAKRPILAFGSPGGSADQLLKSTGMGYLFHPHDLQGIRGIVNEWHVTFQALGYLPFKGNEDNIRKNSWTYRIQEFLEILQKQGISS